MKPSNKTTVCKPSGTKRHGKQVVVTGEKLVETKNDINHGDLQQSKLATKRRRFDSKLKYETSRYNRSESTNRKQTGSRSKRRDDLSDVSMSSNAELGIRHQSKAISNTGAEQHKNYFKSLALTSFVSFVCGALLSVLLLTYTQIDLFSTPSDRASWRDEYPIRFIVTIILVYFVGGALKGLVGLGMALIAVPVIGLLYDPVLAATLVAIPLIVSNVRQGLFSGILQYTLRSYSPFIISMSVAMLPTVYFSNHIQTTYISVLLGVLAITYALMNLGFKLPAIPDSNDHAAQILFGTAAGVAGGLSGLIAIPLAFYVFSRNIVKHTAVSVMGLAFLISGVALFVGHLINGNLTYQLVLLSVIATIPGLVGTLTGEIFRNHINTELFRKIFLVVVLLIGIKILLSQ